MFTGIVQSLGTIAASTPTAAGRRLTVKARSGGLATSAITPGDSVCVSGVCLTAVNIDPQHIEFDVITETLHRTTLGSKSVGGHVNLELSLRPDSFVGGHFVQGHVDAIATVAAISQNPLDWRITFSLAPALMVYLVPKGSVAVDGVSMTIAEVAADRFTLAVIPTTLERTTLGAARVGDPINVETDILARTVVHFLRNQSGGTVRPATPVTVDKLRQLGFV